MKPRFGGMNFLLLTRITSPKSILLNNDKCYRTL